MIKSMTGFGKKTIQIGEKSITIEIRTLNGKQADTHIKLPQLYRDLESDIRNLLNSTLIRGKMELHVWIDSAMPDREVTINQEMIKEYLNQLQKLGKEIDLPGNETLLPAILRMPEILTMQRHELDPKESRMVKEAILQAIDDTDQFRIQEGKALETDLIQQIKRIQEGVERIDSFEAERREHVRNRLNQSLDEIRERIAPDMNRFEQELIYYLEKLDINEEKVRLKNHCLFFLETMKTEGSPGRKLGFIAQEIGREINTIGSKAGHSDIQRTVVAMKDELEKIKEQVLNVL